jgi:hypothetical protein
VQALQQDLIAVDERDRLVLTEAARRMVEQPVRAA